MNKLQGFFKLEVSRSLTLQDITIDSIDSIYDGIFIFFKILDTIENIENSCFYSRT